MKNLIVTRNIPHIKRGAFNLARRLSRDFPDTFDFINGDEFTPKVRERYQHVIWNFQSPRSYGSRFNYIQAALNRDPVFVRNEQSFPNLNSFSNGFYVWRNSPYIKSYLPLFTFDKEMETDKSVLPTLVGFYNNITCDLEAKAYAQIIRENKTVQFLNLGHRIIDADNCRQTYDEVYFFQNITHFLYVPDRAVYSPFPNSLLEAVLSGATPIILGLEDRPFQDGATEISEVIRFLNKFDLRKRLNNKDTILNPRLYTDFYNSVFPNFQGFEQKCEFSKFSDLLEHILNGGF